MFVCLCVCLYTLFSRHDRRTATIFGTHMRIDLEMVRTKTKLISPHPNGAQGELNISGVKKGEEGREGGRKRKGGRIEGWFGGVEGWRERGREG